MLELYTPNYEVINTKERITIDLIKDGQEFLHQFDINPDLLLDSISLVYKYLRSNGKIPHNVFKFFIAAYYIISRHPFAFPIHESKKSVLKYAFLSSWTQIIDDIVETYEDELR